MLHGRRKWMISKQNCSNLIKLGSSTPGCDGLARPLKSFTGWSFLYLYTADLICLQLHRPRSPHNSVTLSSVRTPLNIEAWAGALAAHPNRAFDRYICEGLKFSFRIGFQDGSPLQSAKSNMPSVKHHSEVVKGYLQDDLAKGRMLWPFSLRCIWIRLEWYQKGTTQGNRDLSLNWRHISSAVLSQRFSSSDTENLCSGYVAILLILLNLPSKLSISTIQTATLQLRGIFSKRQSSTSDN